MAQTPFNDAFWRWFGDSKIVKGGKPLMVYHGTTENFDVFEKAKRGSATLAKDAKGAFFFTDSPDVAADFAGYLYVSPDGEHIVQQFFSGANIMPVYLRVKNPAIWDFHGGGYTDAAISEAIKDAKRNGHDGVIFTNLCDLSISTVGPCKVSNVIAVFSPTQIKSVNNQGTWDGNDPHITHNPDANPKRIILPDFISDFLEQITKTIYENRMAYSTPNLIIIGPMLLNVNNKYITFTVSTIASENNVVLASIALQSSKHTNELIKADLQINTALLTHPSLSYIILHNTLLHEFTHLYDKGTLYDDAEDYYTRRDEFEAKVNEFYSVLLYEVCRDITKAFFAELNLTTKEAIDEALHISAQLRSSYSELLTQSLLNAIQTPKKLRLLYQLVYGDQAAQLYENQELRQLLLQKLFHAVQEIAAQPYRVVAAAFRE